VQEAAGPRPLRGPGADVELSPAGRAASSRRGC
jgi:hypothetical protein